SQSGRFILNRPDYSATLSRIILRNNTSAEELVRGAAIFIFSYDVAKVPLEKIGWPVEKDDVKLEILIKKRLQKSYTTWIKSFKADNIKDIDVKDLKYANGLCKNIKFEPKYYDNDSSIDGIFRTIFILTKNAEIMINCYPGNTNRLNEVYKIIKSLNINQLNF
ncbi:MAG: hypothetical protein DKM50_04270, partial [Candidatus Margulisiibacteriota bacterium]